MRISSLLALFPALILTACPPQVEETIKGRDLVRMDEEPPGENCANGGTAIFVGLDSNGDGSLQDEEIEGSQYVCNGSDGEPGEQGGSGSNGQSSLLSMNAEPAGANCSNGGVAVSAGVDDNGDGTLQAEEVDTTIYVCNGEDGGGGTGSNGTLISTTEEAPGANCSNGGVQVSTGLDDNGDGVLQGGEVDATLYVCNGEDLTPPSYSVVEGSFTIENDLDIAALAGVQQITGTLYINSVGLSSISLPDLQEVGNLSVSSQDLGTLDLPNLTIVDGDVYFSSTPEGITDLPSVTTIGGTLYFYYLDITDIDGFNSLQSVGSINVQENYYLSDISGFAALQTVTDSVSLMYNYAMTDISGMASLDTIGGSLYMGNYSNMTDLDVFNNLVSIGGSLDISDYYLTDVSGFSSLRNIGGDLDVSYLYQLTDLTGFGSLQTIGGGFYAYGCYMLQTPSGFGSMRQVGGIGIDNTLMTDLSFLPSTTNYTNGVYIAYNYNLTDISPLNAATAVGGDLTINGYYGSNGGIFPVLASVGGSLTLDNMPNITSLTGFGLLSSVGSSMSISNIDQITALTVFNRVTSLSGTLSIQDNDSLATLSGFQQLTSVSYLYLDYNYSLTSISGFNRISTVGQVLELYYNPVLTGLGGIANIDDIGDYAYFYYNYDLCQTTIDTFLNGLNTLGGSYTYSNSGC